MSRLLRIAVMVAGFFVVMYLIRYLMRSINPTPPKGRDSAKEVKGASFKSEDVEDAKFRDVK